MGLLEDIQAQNARLEASMDLILEKLNKQPDDVVWRTPVEIQEEFRLERRMFRDLLTAGKANGKIRTIAFFPNTATNRPQERIDAVSFRKYLEAGGVTQ